MKESGLFLIDETSLTDDSVLQRLNSVLEPEKGYQSDDLHIHIIKAHGKFRLIPTINPSGNFREKRFDQISSSSFSFCKIKIYCFSFHQHYVIVLQKFSVHQLHDFQSFSLQKLLIPFRFLYMQSH